MKVVMCQNCGAKYQLDDADDINAFECSVCAGILEEVESFPDDHESDYGYDYDTYEIDPNSVLVFCKDCGLKYQLDAEDDVSEFECTSCGGPLDYVTDDTQVIRESEEIAYYNGYQAEDVEEVPMESYFEDSDEDIIPIHADESYVEYDSGSDDDIIPVHAEGSDLVDDFSYVDEAAPVESGLDEIIPIHAEDNAESSYDMDTYREDPHIEDVPDEYSYVEDVPDEYSYVEDVPNEDSYIDDFDNGDSYIENEPYSETYPEVDYEIDALPFPAEYVGAGCGGYAILKDNEKEVQKISTGETAKTVDLCWDFLKFIISEEGQNLAGKEGYIQPVLKKLADSGNWLESYDGKINNAAFANKNAKELRLDVFCFAEPEKRKDLRIEIGAIFFNNLFKPDKETYVDLLDTATKNVNDILGRQ
jgi:hypothetical protein